MSMVLLHHSECYCTRLGIQMYTHLKVKHVLMKGKCTTQVITSYTSSWTSLLVLILHMEKLKN